MSRAVTFRAIILAAGLIVLIVVSRHVLAWLGDRTIALCFGR